MNNNDTMTAEDFRRLADYLPESVTHMAALIGWDETANLINRLGGSQIPVGMGIRQHGSGWRDVLADVLSPEALQAVTRAFGGDSGFVVPKCDRARRERRNHRFVCEVNSAIRDGLSTRKALAILCPRFGIGNTLAWRILKEYREKHASATLRHDNATNHTNTPRTH
ncbi:hypothetical protein EX412_11490 [Salmonella enterica]|uniref:Mor transcription activator family protein n=1 Tax=Salmonella enterica TaxID=28901 RepID=UPI00142C8A60|nr:Mor transcription activator family protein [Salmonella enterica]EAT1106840.1 hypothetical protein [Salmonella enterica]EBU3473084.1 hypothetical protein [Salmonella enterica]EIM7760992.1 hypothetical protein [Salmonella enterica]EIM7764145.1 hypothetical protein [Salmonella enterica]ELS6764339.1 hypothetical protein [Salmonella enterica]